MIYDTIVIGAGAAGMTAALNVLRNGLSVLVLEKETIGGQIASSPKIENYPSIKEISGVDFSSNLFDQITSLGADFEIEEVKKVEKVDGIFKITTDYGLHEGKTVIIATGAKHNKMNVLGEDTLKGVSYCAVCDGSFYKDEEIAVIGDANTALQYVLLLANYAKTVHLCMLFDHYFAEKILIDKVEARNNVKIYKEISLDKIDGNTSVTGLDFHNTKNNELLHLEVKAVFIAIGQTPDTEIFKDLVERDRSYIITDEDMKTKTDGLYAVGDVRKKKVRQLTTAEADSAIAAFNVSKYLS